jgi:hypothetical protein
MTSQVLSRKIKPTARIKEFFTYYTWQYYPDYLKILIIISGRTILINDWNFSYLPKEYQEFSSA